MGEVQQNKWVVTGSLIVIFAIAAGLAVWTFIGSPGGPGNTPPKRPGSADNTFQGGAVPLSRKAAQRVKNPYAVDEAFVAAGKRLYSSSCIRCHGVMGDKPPSHRFTEHSSHHTEGDYAWVVTYGLSGTAMEGQAGSLSLKERWQVVSYIRKTFASPVTHGHQ